MPSAAAAAAAAAAQQRQLFCSQESSTIYSVVVIFVPIYLPRGLFTDLFKISISFFLTLKYPQMSCDGLRNNFASFMLLCFLFWFWYFLSNSAVANGGGVNQNS